jgi:hypothetical protein
MRPSCEKNVKADTKDLEITYVERISTDKTQLDRAFDLLFEVTLPDWSERDEVDSTQHRGPRYTINIGV